MQFPRVGKVVRFRRRRWTRARDFGAKEDRLRFWADEDRVTVRGVARETLRWLRALRPAILLAILVLAWPAMDPALIDPPEMLTGASERIDARFTRCGHGRGHACVIDGDTFRLGERRIRVIGIDAPEVDAQCPEESRLAGLATAALQEKLNRGPFEMLSPIWRSKDRYGRELMTLRRKRPDGSDNSIAAQMRETGLVRRYAGGFRMGWC